jgi:SAM-dependent methyltransferase
LPRGNCLQSGLPIISGWLATDQEIDLDAVRLTVSGGPELSYTSSSRPDVEALFSGQRVLGFTALLDETYWSQPELQVQLWSDGTMLAEMPIAVAPGAAEAVASALRQRIEKRNWCLAHARCTLCLGRSLELAEREILCRRCGTVFPQDTAALNLMTPEAYRRYAPKRAASTSGNPYDLNAQTLISEISARGGMTLDCGAGLRPEPNEAVVNLEIGDYPSTDILGVGEDLPFQDCVFDAVLSITVLEHVADPFRCARELVRVLKPGGRLYVIVPFIEPLHGYPHHFFNITPEGLRTLFPDLIVESHTVPSHGLPIHGLHWILQQYAANLRSPARERFLGMTIGDLLAKPASEHMDDPIVRDLEEQGIWTLASETALFLRK